MYLYGGLKGVDNSPHLYALNLDTLIWSIVKTVGDAPEGRDDHAYTTDDNNMYIFGGFVRGTRVNDVYAFNYAAKSWSKLSENNVNQGPRPRAASSIVIYNNSLYVFGGHDEDNEKLSDLWKFDITQKTWTEECGPFDDEKSPNE